MYKSYFKIGWRNLVKNKGYSFINIAGLASGMAIAMLIGLWISDEVTINKNYQHYDRLVQVMQNQTIDENVNTSPSIPRPLENAMRDTYGSDFSHFSMASWPREHILSSADKKITQTGNYFQVDFPEMISLKMIEGSRKGLKDPSSILLSSSAASALFGSANPMNRVVKIDNTQEVKVTGVYQDLPYNSTFGELQFISSWELLVASQEWMKRAADRWDNNSFQLFAQLAPEADVEQVSDKIKNIRADITKDITFKPEIFLHPMRDWHLRSNWKDGIKSDGRIQMVWMFGIIGGFVLFLACINFMNLSTARSESRAKEVGVRMSIGSERGHLINQFLTESFLVVSLAFVFAMGLVTTSLTWFNALADKRITIEWSNPIFWLIGISFVFITSLLAGSYPAFFLSSFRPVNVLKGSFKTGKLGALPRKALVVVQFTVSIALVVGTLVVYEQIQFSKSRPTGYNRDGLIMIPVKSPDLNGKYETLHTALKNTGAVKEVAESSSPLTQIWSNSGGFHWSGKDPKAQFADFGIIAVTREYGRTIEWKIAEGRDFSIDFPSDSMAVILNEAAVKFMGVRDPIGMELKNGEETYHVIGVVKDMVVESPYSEIRHNLYFLDSKYQRVNWINVKLNPDKTVSESLAAVESVVREFAPSVPFDYRFTDQEYAKKFALEERIGKLAYVFAGLATFISCLGLIGLASFVAEQHRKEIGIRKVLGASIAQIWKMLSMNFVILVMISSVIAIPIASYFMRIWLLRIQYHIEISWTTIALVEFGALMITLLTVSYQAINAAIANPVNSLRSE
jgi:ABC-type antimicrobial peptide transport system permease subunit